MRRNAGIIDAPPAVRVDGFDTHFETNHLEHSMLIRDLIPTLLKTAEAPEYDVRIVILIYLAWRLRPIWVTLPSIMAELN